MSAGATAQLARGLCFNEIFVLYFLIFSGSGGKFPAVVRHPCGIPQGLGHPPPSCCSPSHSSQLHKPRGSWGGLGFQRHPHPSDCI